MVGAAPPLLPDVVVGGGGAAGVEKKPTHPGGEAIPAMIAAHSSIDAVVVIAARGSVLLLSPGRAACLRRSHFCARTRRGMEGGEQIEYFMGCLVAGV